MTADSAKSEHEGDWSLAHLAAQWLSENKHNEATSEDDYACSTLSNGNVEINRFCICDGASESFMGRKWAHALSRWFIENPITEAVSDSVQRLILEDNYWNDCLRDIKCLIEKNKKEGKVVGYAQEERLKDGSASTLLLVEITFDERFWLRWWAVGDSCLFLVRAEETNNMLSIDDSPDVLKGHRVESFPLKRAGDFSSYTSLIFSNSTLNAGLSSKMQSGELTLHKGDLVYLMSDALSEWFLRSWEEGTMPWLEIESCDSKEQFEGLIARLRNARAIKNDDVTLCKLRV